LKYLRRHPIPRLTIAGGFGKLSKLAGGAMDLHSGRSEVDREQLAEVLLNLGATLPLAMAVRSANTAGEILGLAQSAGLALGDAIAARARDQALTMLDGDVAVRALRLHP